jgi:hypothetical protein
MLTGCWHLVASCFTYISRCTVNKVLNLNFRGFLGFCNFWHYLFSVCRVKVETYIRKQRRLIVLNVVHFLTRCLDHAANVSHDIACREEMKRGTVTKCYFRKVKWRWSVKVDMFVVIWCILWARVPVVLQLNRPDHSSFGTTIHLLIWTATIDFQSLI